MQNTYGFVDPRNYDEAQEMYSQMKADAADINMQLQDPENVKDREWVVSARRALKAKLAGKHFYLQHIHKLKPKKQEKQTYSLSGETVNLVAHLRFHSKLVGRLNDLLNLVEEHLEKNDDDTWDRLHTAVEEIRSMQ